MTDDIVTRLRKYVNDEYLSYRHVLEAADEIERLRQNLEKMRQVVISEHRRWCDRPCNAEEWDLHE